MESKKVVEVFWTGGFDSTFRVVELSRCNVRIVPYYALEHRECEEIEIKAIAKLTEMLRSRPDTIATIDDVILMDESKIIIPQRIAEAYERLKNRYALGSQYAKLAVFASEHPGVELGAVKGGKLRTIVEENGALECIEDAEIGKYFQVNKEVSSSDINLILGHYHFGLLEKSKKDMLSLYKEMGYDNEMKQTWFCHHPVNGRPCGVCNPCNIAIEEGLSERLDKRAIFRNKHREFFMFALGVRRRFIKMIGVKS